MPNCHLCNNLLTKDNKCNAHILPKRIFELGVADAYGKNVLILANKYARHKRTKTGTYDNSILCRKCDIKLGVYDKIMLDFLTADHNLISISQGDNIGGWWVVDNVEQTKLLLFILSYLYRASITTKAGYEGVSLGAKYEAIIRNILNGDHARLLDFTTVCGRFVDHDGRVIFSPMRTRNSTDQQNIYKIYLPKGYCFYTKVDQRNATIETKKISLCADDKIWLVNMHDIKDTDDWASMVDMIKSGI